MCGGEWVGNTNDLIGNDIVRKVCLSDKEVNIVFAVFGSISCPSSLEQRVKRVPGRKEQMWHSHELTLSIKCTFQIGPREERTMLSWRLPPTFLKPFFMCSPINKWVSKIIANNDSIGARSSNENQQHRPFWKIFSFKKLALTPGYFFFKDFVNLFMRDTEREAETGRDRQREKQAPCWEPNLGLNPGSPGSCAGLKAALNRWATGAALTPG